MTFKDIEWTYRHFSDLHTSLCCHDPLSIALLTSAALHIGQPELILCRGWFCAQTAAGVHSGSLRCMERACSFASHDAPISPM